jgi:hypothetical protein
MNYDGAGKWLRLTVVDAGGDAAVKSVAVQGGSSSSWQQLSNTWGATWETGGAPGPPLSFQVGLQLTWVCCCLHEAVWLAISPSFGLAFSSSNPRSSLPRVQPAIRLVPLADC